MKKIISFCLLVVFSVLFMPQSSFASSAKAFVVVGEDSSDLIISDGSNYYLLDYDWNCSSTDFTEGEVFYIDTYYTPTWGDDIYVQDWLGEWETCSVSSIDSLNLKPFYVTDILDSNDEIIAYDEYGQSYLIEYGVGCLSMWKYEDSYIYIDVGSSFLDGISDDIYLIGDGDSCMVWDVEELDGDYSGSSGTYTYTDTTAPDYSSAILYAYTDSTKTETLSLSAVNSDKTPYFEWTGVTDLSGIFTYVVYFGTDVTADPYGSDGTAVISPNYSATNISKDGDYYLIVKAIDVYGNISSGFYWTYSYEEAEEEDVCVDTTNGYLGTDGNCYCNSGYIWSDDVYACVENESTDGNDESVFTDVSTDDEYYEAINGLYEAGIIEGYSDGTYKPDNSINRAEFAKILIGAVFTSEISLYQDKSCFSDVSTGNWFAPYVCLAQDEGIIEGYPDGSFGASNNINVVEALKITLESMVDEIPEVEGEWYEKYVEYAQDHGWYLSAWISSDQNITRGEMAELIYEVALDL